MSDLTTKYLGLLLRNPIVVGSSGLTDSVDSIIELEKAGAGAIVLKSLFEEQIMLEADASLKEAYKNDFIYTAKSETLDYIDIHIKERTLSKYIELIKEVKRKTVIPIIASVNCVSPGEWVNFAKRFQDAGIDALELNIALLPSDESMTVEQTEKIYFDIIRKVMSQISIPLSVKISPYFTNLSKMIIKLSETGIKGLVMFNRFYTPDFDINNFSEQSANTYSLPSEAGNVMRWIAIMAGKVSCDLAASSGIHDSEALIKQILAGAEAVQVVSTIYKNGREQIQIILSGLDKWMDEKGFNNIGQFRGKLSQSGSSNPAAYERIQFMKYFSEI